MNYRTFLVSFCCAVTSLILTGCRQQVQEEIAQCPAAEKGVDTLGVLKSRFEKTLPLKANGQCFLLYYVEGKPHKENFPVQLWVNPPYEIYLQGDVAFDAKGIILGSNRQQFWLAMQPKEISTYWWGDWSQQSSLETMLINPRVVLEGLGIVEISEKENWTFSQQGSFEVLTRRQDGLGVKRIFVSSHDKRVRRIEYVGTEGEAVTVAELDRYVKVSEGFYVPAVVKIIRRLARDKQSFMSITINLSTIKSVSFTDQQRQRIFQRRPMRGFKHIYRIVDGKVIE